MGDGVEPVTLKPVKVSTPGAVVAALKAACEVKTTTAAWAAGMPAAATAKRELDATINDANASLNFI